MSNFSTNASFICSTCIIFLQERPLLVKFGGNVQTTTETQQHQQRPLQLHDNTTFSPSSVSVSSATVSAVTTAAGGGRYMSEYDKKQARMIKNREAATLSRKRRKVCCVTGSVYIFVT